MMIDVFDRNPSMGEISNRAKLNYAFRHPLVETQKLLTHPDLFDVIEIHSLGDYTELDATMAWLRGEMLKTRYDKPVFIGDTVGVSQMIWGINLRAFTPNATDADFLTFAPIRPNDAIRVLKLFETIKDANAPEHDAVTRWYRAEHARAIVKRFATAMAAGYAGMNAWSIADFSVLQLPSVTGGSFFQGMIDAQPGFGTWTPGAPRPAYYALKQTVDKLKDYASVEKLNVGATIVAYRLIVRGKPVIVAWNEPGRIYFPGETEPVVKANISINAARAKITHTITDSGTSTPRMETVSTSGGSISLTLDSTPVFIELEN